MSQQRVMDEPQAVGQVAGNLGPGASPADEAPPLASRFRRWLSRGVLLGVVASFMVHLVLLLIAAFWVYGPGSLGSPDGTDGFLDINVALEQSLDDVSGELPELDTNASIDSLLADLSQPSELTGFVADDIDLGSDTLADLVDSLGGSGGGGATDGLGLDGAGAGGGAGASFFGVEAVGNRFAFIVDISGSMRGMPMVILQRELIASIDSLLPHMLFAVVFFNHADFPMFPGNPWTEASGSGKQRANERINQVEANGGTDPRSAFARVFTMRPRPDAIYFMTDGFFDEAIADELAISNVGRHKVAIHCITFIDDSAALLMRRIADDSGGTYTHIPGPGS